MHLFLSERFKHVRHLPHRAVAFQLVFFRCNPADLQNGIMTLIADEDLRNTLSQQARQDVLENHSLKSALDVEYRVYKQLINQTSHNGPSS